MCVRFLFLVARCTAVELFYLLHVAHEAATMPKKSTGGYTCCFERTFWRFMLPVQNIMRIIGVPLSACYACLSVLCIMYYQVCIMCLFVYVFCAIVRVIMYLGLSSVRLWVRARDTTRIMFGLRVASAKKGHRLGGLIDVKHERLRHLPGHRSRSRGVHRPWGARRVSE